MASARTRATGVAVLAVLLVALTGCSAQTVTFLPDGGQTRELPVGGSLAISCIVDAPDPSLVTRPIWRDENGNVIEKALHNDYEPSLYTQDVENEQSKMLVLKLVTHAMAGNYTCESSYTSIPISKSIRIITYIPLTWNNANDNQFATKGEDYKVMCEVTAEPPPTVKWFKDSVKIVTGDRYVVHTNGLLIKNVQESDEGTYTCEAYVRQTGQVDAKSIRLEIHTSPEILEHELNAVLKEGETNSITCRARGNPEPQYSWIKEATKEDLSLNPRFRVKKYTGELIFLKTEALDYGTYTCYTINGAGQNKSSWEVEILVPPRIFEFTNISSPEGTDAALECKARGRPAPRMTFRKLSNKDPYVHGNNEDGRITMFETASQDGDHMVSTGVLSITNNLRRSDDGLYECIARSPYPNGGEARKNGHLTVQFKPTFENMPRVPFWSWNAQPTNISCLAESIPNATIKWRFRDADLVESPHVRIYGSGPYSYVTIHPTDRSLYGYYKCIATNPLGEAEHTIQLREAYPPGPIAQATVKKISATTVEFDIVGPGEDMGPPIVAYTTQYKDDRNHDWTFAKNRTWSANSPYVVEDLIPTYGYDFRFAAINQVGVGTWAFSTAVTMPKRSPPEAPTWRENITSENLISSKYLDRYELRWRIPAHNGEPIDMYEIEICPVVNVSGEWRVSKDHCQKRELKSHDVANYMVSGLASGTRYRMSLRAHNALGLSPPAELLVETDIGTNNDNDGMTFFEKVGNDKIPKLSSGAIIGLALAGVFLCLIIVDLILFCWKRIGVVASLCTRQVPSHTDEESKHGSYIPTTPVDEKEPLKETGDVLMKRNSSVEFDGHRTYATSGGHIIGKNSAV